MKNILKISAAAVAMTLLLNSCIKEATPTDVATEDQVTLETQVRGIPAALVQAGSTGYAQQGAAWDFSLPAIHIATESMTGDLVVTGNIGYDWFGQWGTNDALGADYAVGALTWDNYYTWIMMANNVINLIDASDLSALDATERSYLGFAYAYRAMFYFDLVRLYEFKENTVTKADNLLGLGVPIVLPSTTEAEAKNNPRAKVDDIYDTIIFPDLDTAEELLSTFTPSDKYTISLPLIYGMKARAYLERGTAKNDAEAYKKAAEYARKAITASACTPLTQEQWEDPTNGFNNANSNNAWIWALALPSESVSNLFCYTVHMSCENDWAPYHAGRGINRNLYNSIDTRDFPGAETLSTRGWIRTAARMPTRAAARTARPISLRALPTTPTSSSAQLRVTTRTTRWAEPLTTAACASRRCTSSRPRLRHRAETCREASNCSTSS